MVKGRIYKLANLDKNKRDKRLVSYNHGMPDGIGWLWTSNPRAGYKTAFADGDIFVCLGKREHEARDNPYYGATRWYETVGPDGNIHRITPAIRSSYFRSP